MDMMDKGKGKEFFINLNDENFDYQYDSNEKAEFDDHASFREDFEWFNNWRCMENRVQLNIGGGKIL